jgi:hypothetical protein
MPGECVGLFKDHMNGFAFIHCCDGSTKLVGQALILHPTRRVTAVYLDDTSLITGSADWTVIVHQFA